MALVVIAGKSVGMIEEGDILGIYPDGKFLGRMVSAKHDMLVVQVENLTKAQRGALLKEHVDDRKIETRLSQRGIHVTAEELAKIQAAVGLRDTRRLRHRVRGVAFSLMSVRLQDSIRSGGKPVRMTAVAFETFIRRRVSQREEDDARDAD